MSEWALKRFWNEAQVVAGADGFAVQLDGRPVRTPGKSLLAVPSQGMAEAIAREWDAQEDRVDPVSMPFTRSANTAIDKVRAQKSEVAQMLAEYGDADLLCYRADGPDELIRRQAEAWDAALDWAADALGARLAPLTGVMHTPQDAQALARLADRVHAMSDFQLVGFHDLVTLSGSLILGFAAAGDWRDPETLWQMSRIDDLWQEEQWGRDELAHDAAETKRAAFHHAKSFFDLS